MLNRFYSKILGTLVILSLFAGCKGSSRQRMASDGHPRSKEDVERAVPLRWPKQILPLKIFIEQNFDNDEISVIDESLDKWEKAVDYELQFAQIASDKIESPKIKSFNAFRDDVLGIYKIESWFENEDPNTLGLTQYFGVRKLKNTPHEYIELRHADIFVNYEHHTYFSYDRDRASSYDFKIVILHELGHFLGLPHNETNPNSIMKTSISPTTVISNIHSDDIDLLRQMYELNPLNKEEADLKGDLLYLKEIERDERPEWVRGIIRFKLNEITAHRKE